ncbi:unnamed protein product [Clavelina lepadiformis]|uniref:Right handed beta helix domain-containing protein n=1 Tax=Clavelina lepadiformis TaxID=159417 RepID=A0ABP0F888_CLALP
MYRKICIGVLLAFIRLLLVDASSQESRILQNRILQLSRSADFFYLDAENGNDKWNGKRPTPEEGTGPFKTFIGAIDGIRAQRAFPNEKDSKLSIVGYPGDKRPVISGAVKISGKNFTPLGDKIFFAPFKGKCSKHVFLGKKRLIRARKPNLKKWTGSDMTGEGPYLTIKDLLHPTSDCDRQASGGYRQKNCHPNNKMGFIFEQGDIDPNWSNPKTGDIVIFQGWTAERGHIKNVSAGNILEFTKPLRFPIGEHPKSSGFRYIVEHIFEELDATGEFFCDEEAQILYLIPPEDALLDKDVFIASEDTFFIITDTKDIQFEGLEFRHSHDRNFNSYSRKPSVFHVEQTRHFSVKRCLFSNIGYTGILIYKSCNYIQIHKSKFSDVGYFAIDSSAQTKNLFIFKNTFEGCGVTNMFQPSCLHIRGAENIKISGNKISRSSYAGMRIGWQSTFTKDYVSEGRYVFHVVRNDVSNYGMGILSDFAGIYLASHPGCSGPKANLSNCHLHARVAFNTIHNASAYRYGGMGIYGDTAVSSLTVENNWLYDLDGAAVNFHCGQNNVALNNMIYHVKNGRIFGTCNAIVGKGVLLKQDLTFKKNVIYVTHRNGRLWRPFDAWRFDAPAVDNNVYYFSSDDLRQKKQFFPKTKSFGAWQRNLNDLKSIVGDPKFMDTKNRDFRLKSSSVARNIGIKSFDLRKYRT